LHTFEEVLDPDSEYLYLVNRESSHDELEFLIKYNDALKKTNYDSTFAEVHQTHLKECLLPAAKMKEMEYRYGFEDFRFVKVKPPEPCPFPPHGKKIMSSIIYIAFFSRSTKDYVNVYINNELVQTLKKGDFLDSTQTRIIPFSYDSLNIQKGDTLWFKVPIVYKDSLDSIFTENFPTEKIIKK
jgi:hypothetical protein